MLKCVYCTSFTWDCICRKDDQRKECSCKGDATKCELYPDIKQDAIEKREAELNRRYPAGWINFDEQKPVHGDEVLGVDSSGNMDIYQFSEDWPNCLMKFNGNIKQFDITHWMALPKAPE